MVLNKRIPRSIKARFFRWLALFLLVFLGMFMVVSLVTSAEVVTTDIEKFAEEKNLEDGEFSVFVPLTERDIKELDDSGCRVEQSFYIDFAMNDDDDSTVRIFRNREDINVQCAKKGAPANHADQIMIEEHYAEAHELEVGDSIEIAGEKFEITGIAVSPDYDNVKQNISDVGINHAGFGTAFVNDEGYELLKATGKYKNTEEYLYSYKLSGDMDHDKLKEMLQDMEFDTDEIKDEYLRDIIEKFEEEKNDILDGVNDLKDAGHELDDAVEELSDGTADYSKSADDYRKMLEQLLSSNEAYAPLVAGGAQLAEGAETISDGAEKLHDGSEEFADAIDEFSDKVIDMVDENYKLDIDNLTMFVKADDNPRIKASIGDAIPKKSSGTVSGVIVLCLITFVISVFITHEINEESAVIGALYSMGVSKGSLLRHYIALPVIITFAGGLLGTLCAFTPMGTDNMLKSMKSYYSLPELAQVYPLYIIIYGIVVPPLIAMIVNTLVINKKLSQSPLSLLRKQSKDNVRTVKLKSDKRSFNNQFRIRQFIREMKASFTIFFGMFISLLFLLLSMTCFCSLDNFEKQNNEDLKYKYMYSLKYELEDEDIPKNAEQCYVTALSREVMGYDMDITLIGVDDDNKYFEAKPEDKKNSVVLGSSTAIKFGFKEGDIVSFRDKLNDRIYEFEVSDIAQYSAGLYMFMDIDRMRTLFDKEEDYFNVLFSDEELDIDTNMIYSLTKDSDILYFAKSFKANLNSVIYMMLGASIIMFVVVMYLMINMTLEKSANSISLMKIFGYTDGEVRKLYLDGNFLVVLISAIVAIPLAKLCTNSIWPMMVANMQCGFDVSLPPYLYAVVFGVIMVCYLVVSIMLILKIRKITPAEMLKNRE